MKNPDEIYATLGFIIGNPPFLGSKLFRQYGLPDDYIEGMYECYDLPNTSDLCCYWFELARRHVAQPPSAGEKTHPRAGVLQTPRVGLLATQGIRGGDNRRVLERIKEMGDIFMGWSDREWILDGAHVHVSMLGFDGGQEQRRELDGVIVENITVDLRGDANTAAAARLAPNDGVAFMGDTKGGAFDIPQGEAKKLLVQPNPNARSNAEVVVPWVNGLDITRRARSMWIIDFGCDMDEATAAGFEAPFEHVRRHVKPTRIRNRRKAYAERWWLHVEPRPAMRKALPEAAFIGTPILTKHRLFVFVDGATLPDHQLIVFARSDDYFFGVLHSSIHELWARRMGTQLREVESGFRYTPTTCFETFPLPWVPGEEPGSHPGAGVLQDAKAAEQMYRRNLPHIQPPPGRTVFVTFATSNRWVLPEALRGRVLEHCLHDHGTKLWMHGAVVMPDHVHLVFTPLEDRLGNPFGLAEIMSGIKGASAHSVNKLLGRKGHVWQDESFDHILRRNENIQEKVEYICLNPVRKGLVADENDYPWLWREWIEGSDVAQPPTAGSSEKTHPGAGVLQDAGVLQGLHRRIADAARELNEQRERWLNPPEWIKAVANYVDAQDDFGDVPEDARGLIRQSAIMAEAARDSRLRRRTLTNLYNERPTWLHLAHEKLDRAVLAAYAATDPEGEWSEEWAEVWTESGAGQPLPDEHPLGERRKQIDQQVLGNLLRLNLARAEASEES